VLPKLHCFLQSIDLCLLSAWEFKGALQVCVKAPPFSASLLRGLITAALLCSVTGPILVCGQCTSHLISVQLTGWGLKGQ
jgi:hypothetical protein